MPLPAVPLQHAVLSAPDIVDIVDALVEVVATVLGELVVLTIVVPIMVHVLEQQLVIVVVLGAEGIVVLVDVLLVGGRGLLLGRAAGHLHDLHDDAQHEGQHPVSRPRGAERCTGARAHRDATAPPSSTALDAWFTGILLYRTNNNYGYQRRTDIALIVRSQRVFWNCPSLEVTCITFLLKCDNSFNYCQLIFGRV